VQLVCQALVPSVRACPPALLTNHARLVENVTGLCVTEEESAGVTNTSTSQLHNIPNIHNIEFHLLIDGQ